MRFCKPVILADNNNHSLGDHAYDSISSHRYHYDTRWVCWAYNYVSSHILVITVHGLACRPPAC